MRNTHSSFSHRSHAGPSSGAAMIGADEDLRGHQGPPGAGNYRSGPVVKPFHRTFPAAPRRAAEVVLGGGAEKYQKFCGWCGAGGAGGAEGAEGAG